MTTLPKQGAKVTWTSPQGEVAGTVVTTVTSPTTGKGHVAKATKQHPQVLVKSDKSGKEATHRPGELKRS